MFGEKVAPLFRRCGKGAIEMFAPPRCHVCGYPLWGCENPFLCAACVDKVEWIGKGACRACGYPAGKFAAWGETGCSKCRGRRLGLDEVVAVARYAGGAKELVKALKFGGERTVAAAMGGLMAERVVKAGLAAEIDMVVPISLHGKRLRERGFDQAGLLARTVAARLEMKLVDGIVKRMRATKPQATLRKAERLSSMDGVFEAGDAVKGKALLLVDDVITTGATMSACAKACKKAGARKVYGVAFAR